jgi:hypothetical protein
LKKTLDFFKIINIRVMTNKKNNNESVVADQEDSLSASDQGSPLTPLEHPELVVGQCYIAGYSDFNFTLAS